VVHVYVHKVATLLEISQFFIARLKKEISGVQIEKQRGGHSSIRAKSGSLDA